MAKATVKPKLEVGQRVWIETRSMFIKEERTIHEYEVIKANNSSAYIANVKTLEKHLFEGKNESGIFTERVEQKTHRVKSSFPGYSEILWLSIEAFECNVQHNKELKDLRAKAIYLVNQMNADELRKVLEI